MISSTKHYLALPALLLLFCFGTPAKAQRILPLDSVLQIIRSNNPMVLQYETRAKAMDAYAEGATSWMAPMVGGGVYMLPYTSQDMPASELEGSYMLSAEQALPNPAKQRAKKATLNSKAATEQAAAAATFNELRAQAKTAYYTWLVQEKKLDVLQANARIISYMVQLARIRYPYSQGKLGSIYKAEARQHEVENMQLMARSDIAQQQTLLNTLMNLPKEHAFEIDTTAGLPAPVLLAADTLYLRSARSDVRKLETVMETMRLNIAQEQLERKPDVSIRFDHMMPRSTMMSSQFTAMAMVSIPIAPWSSKMYKANTKAMTYEIAAMATERTAILSEAEGMARNMAIELNARHEQVGNYKAKILPALQKNYDVTMLAYEENTAQLPEVIEAWEALNMAQQEYLTNVQELYLLAVKYEKELEK